MLPYSQNNTEIVTKDINSSDSNSVFFCLAKAMPKPSQNLNYNYDLRKSKLLLPATGKKQQADALLHGSQVLAIVPKKDLKRTRKGTSKFAQGPFFAIWKTWFFFMPLIDLVN